MFIFDKNKRSLSLSYKKLATLFAISKDILSIEFWDFLSKYLILSSIEAFVVAKIISLFLLNKYLVLF